MKTLIEREVERRELQDNIKLGPGGIREIEFIVQSLQLIRGGSDRRLRSNSLLRMLPRLAGERLLAPAVTVELAAAYDFLRRLENRLQMYQDQQTHCLPTDADRARAHRAGNGLRRMERTGRGARAPSAARRGALCRPGAAGRRGPAFAAAGDLARGGGAARRA